MGRVLEPARGTMLPKAAPAASGEKLGSDCSICRGRPPGKALPASLALAGGVSIEPATPRLLKQACARAGALAAAAPWLGDIASRPRAMPLPARLRAAPVCWPLLCAAQPAACRHSWKDVKRGGTHFCCLQAPKCKACMPDSRHRRLHLAAQLVCGPYRSHKGMLTMTVLAGGVPPAARDHTKPRIRVVMLGSTKISGSVNLNNRPCLGRPIPHAEQLPQQ